MRRPAGCRSTGVAPGRFTLVVKVGDFDRTASVQIPVGYKPSAKPPLVLMLHGAGGNGPDALDRDGWTAKCNLEGFVVRRARGTSGDLRDGPPISARILRCGTRANSRVARRAAIDDVAFIRQLLDDLKIKVPYDEQRVFCTGHSNGGRMTFRLAAELSERFTAIGTVAGLMTSKDPKPKKPLPTLYILGTKDPFVPIAGGEVKLPWGSVQNPPVAETLAIWAKAIGCATTPRLISEANSLKVVEYPTEPGGAKFRVIYVEGQGHGWPGGQSPLPASVIGPTTNALDATAALWDFFKACGSPSAN